MPLFVRHAWILAVGLAAAGCQPAQMRLAPALAGVTPLAVEGANPRVWNSDIAFGQWRTSQVREGMTWSFGYRLLGIEARYGQQPYQLVLTSGTTQVQAECISRAMMLSRNSLSVDAAFGKLPALSCGFTGAGEGTLRLHVTALNEETGEIAFGNERWSIRSVSSFAGSPIRGTEPVGFELFAQGEIIAAVETINAGRVWIAPHLTLQQQARLAASITVLLLYEPANDAVPI